MFRYVAQRLILLVATLLGVVTITFVLSRVLPGSPVELMMGGHPTQEQIDAKKRELGLDRPIHEQFVMFVGDIAAADTPIRVRPPAFLECLVRNVANVKTRSALGQPLGDLAPDASRCGRDQYPQARIEGEARSLRHVSCPRVPCFDAIPASRPA